MIGSPHVHHRVTDSTNERAKELAGAGAPHGTLVTADEQTAGRGRQGRQWVAPPGRALLMSVVLHANEQTPLVPLAAAVAVCHAFPQANGIKWPNDVWADGRKLAGILIEGRPREGWAVLGIGLNVATAPDEFPEDLRDTATSLRAAGADVATPRDALALFLPVLGAWLEAPADAVLNEWRERDALRGQRISWAGGEGIAAGVDDDGSLLVQTDDAGVQSLHAGEVHLERVGY
jgi:BirA family transcriptional regulator, biotin operon repressor / biotin---[acetyl-CoA-carboxylase] ligase